MKIGLQTIPIQLVVHKKWLQSEMRVRINEAKVKQYAEEKRRGMIFPPPVIFMGPDEIYRVGDGFHRILADKENGETQITANLRSGLLKDAVLHNLKANREGQGLLFSAGDFSKAVRFLLTNKDFQGWSRTKISQAVGCSPSLVSRIAVDELGQAKGTGQHRVVEPEKVYEQLKAGKSCAQVAEELNVAERTVYRRVKDYCYQTCPTCGGSGRILREETNHDRAS